MHLSRRLIRAVLPFLYLLWIAVFAGGIVAYAWTNRLFVGSLTWANSIPLAVSWAFLLMLCVPCTFACLYFLWLALRVITLRADPDDIMSGDGGTS